ncbi:hypothetical protein RJ639_013762 [Escallonia herrerae]|uniref:Uncharacterized protein n=1 Tax=Escallonia herrerae TaxID=1293975 RepID=A0AA88VFM0_9ASTE|nr:hypothetical protein RJ639_013762 [Escallonia herrerae]
MALCNVIDAPIQSDKSISEEVEGAIVYLDAGCTESFQFLGAFPLLLELGAHAFCSLENMSCFNRTRIWIQGGKLWSLCHVY